MDAFAFRGVGVALNPATVGIMFALVHLTWLAITRESSWGRPRCPPEEVATMRRVVITQKAKLDSEREARACSRLAARKAIDVAQRAVQWSGSEQRFVPDCTKVEWRHSTGALLGATPDTRNGRAPALDFSLRTPPRPCPPSP